MRLGATLIAGILVFACVTRVRPLRLGASVCRPFAAAAAMVLLIRLAAVKTGVVVVDLAMSIALGGVAYVAALVTIWAASGRPDGAEKTAFALLRSRVGFQRRGAV